MKDDMGQVLRIDPVQVRHELDVARLRPYWWRPKRGIDAALESEKRGLTQCRSAVELLEKACHQH